ncbi:unnamed protein product [Closterium sp. NIES-53]
MKERDLPASLLYHPPLAAALNARHFPTMPSLPPPPPSPLPSHLSLPLVTLVRLCPPCLPWQQRQATAPNERRNQLCSLPLLPQCTTEWAAATPTVATALPCFPAGTYQPSFGPRPAFPTHHPPSPRTTQHQCALRHCFSLCLS